MSEILSDGPDDLDGLIAADVVPPRAELFRRKKKTFQKWHKPRKQLVRWSWVDNARNLMNDLHVPTGGQRVFRYLTLPAEDMLDVRCMRAAVEECSYRLHYLGFNSAGRNTEEESYLTLSQNQLAAQDWVTDSSRVIWRRLEEIAASEKSEAFGHARSHGPFHAINMDLCDSIAYKSPGSSRPSGLDALGKLIQLQTDQCNHDWLLFIATRVGRSKVSDVYLDRFVDAIRDNACAHEGFRVAMEGMFRRSGKDAEAVLMAPDSVPESVFRDLFCLGLSKWLLKLLQAASPQWGLKMLTGYFYSVYGEEPDMLSLVYRVECRQQRATDSHGVLTGQLPPAKALDEGELAQRILIKTEGLLNLDEKLQKEPDLLATLITETEGLLRDANYDISGYDLWARRFGFE